MEAAKKILPALVLIAFGSFACGGGGSSFVAPLAQVKATVAGGGTLEVSKGELSGLELDIPPGALNEDATIRLNKAKSTLEAGFLAVGPAGRFSPNGLQFNPPAMLTMPFDPIAVPLILDVADVVVLLQDDVTGAIEELVPSLVDVVAGLVEVEIPHLSTAWVVAPLAPITLSNYLPLNIGDEYLLEGLSSGVLGVLRVEPGPDSINFPEPDLVSLVFEIDGFRSGYYIRRGLSGDVTVVGNFGDDGIFSLEESHQFETLFAPDVAEDGEFFETGSAYTGHLPIGNPNVAYTGSYEAFSEVFSPFEAILTPAGLVPDPVIFLRDEFYVDSGGFSGEALAVFWLAAGIGPVALELDGIEIFLLVSGTVNGLPILIEEQR